MFNGATGVISEDIKKFGEAMDSKKFNSLIYAAYRAYTVNSIVVHMSVWFGDGSSNLAVVRNYDRKVKTMDIVRSCY